ncbi:MAG: cell division protein ZapA [Firmicutes bacterium]|nr:cell division protein ZapA [Bacillota bacterium]MCM1400536.1 cell division protein ZapA [Bacteroides sp.]MCM1476440.1 cell division protein ZapA [Bacteroides sp.]
MKDKLDITLKISGTELSLNIDPSEEELLRNVTKQVNHAYKKYNEIFPERSQADILAMVSLLFAKGYVQLKSQLTEMDSTLERLDTDLSALLKVVK